MIRESSSAGLCQYLHNQDKKLCTGFAKEKKKEKMPKQKKHVTKSKMSKYGNFPGLYFATFGLTAKI